MCRNQLLCCTLGFRGVDLDHGGSHQVPGPRSQVPGPEARQAEGCSSFFSLSTVQSTTASSKLRTYHWWGAWLCVQPRPPTDTRVIRPRPTAPPLTLRQSQAAGQQYAEVSSGKVGRDDEGGNVACRVSTWTCVIKLNLILSTVESPDTYGWTLLWGGGCTKKQSNQDTGVIVV